MTEASRRWRLPAAAIAAIIVIGVIWSTQRAAPPGAPATVAPAPAGSSATPAPLSASQVERGIASTRERVQADPKDASGWAMLAHSYEMIGRFDQASEAYQKLIALRPQDAQIHADYADALGVAQRGSLQGEPARLIAKALTLDPNNLKALVLGGKEAFERRRYADAVALWQRALGQTQDGAIRGQIQTSIAEAGALASPAAGVAASGPASASFVAGRVTVAESLKSKIGPDDIVFIFARPPEGSRMPVALLRKRGRDLPLDFALDDSLAMVPQARLSQYPKLLLGVRVSKRGDAIPVSGDLEGELGPVSLGASGLQLEISRARP